MKKKLEMQCDIDNPEEVLFSIPESAIPSYILNTYDLSEYLISLIPKINKMKAFV